MRRNSTDKKYLNLILFSFFLVACQIMGMLYTMLPSFVGVFFTYIILNFENDKKRYYIYLCFIYLMSYELTRGFYLFSYVFSFIIFYNIFVDKIRNNFTCTNCILTLYVAFAYIGHYFINSFIAYLLNEDASYFSNQYIYYIVIDSLLSMIIFKGRA
jgi:hypothetical protein